MCFVHGQINAVNFFFIFFDKDAHLQLYRPQKQVSMICLEFTTKVKIKASLLLHAYTPLKKSGRVSFSRQKPSNSLHLLN